MTENREPRQSRKAATVADLQGVDGRPFFLSTIKGRDHLLSLYDHHWTDPVAQVKLRWNIHRAEKVNPHEWRVSQGGKTRVLFGTRPKMASNPL